ncbi:hypothetical protein K501DRAFT_274725 [Backusella circina FSU 941]|nr:hypothetical protein K501DRAFT_274725 [Backusella circina FSU 941]
MAVVFEYIDGSSLLYNVDIGEHDEDRFNRMMNTFPQSLECAAPAEDLFVTLSLGTHFNRRTVFHIFPNARFMKVVPLLPPTLSYFDDIRTHTQFYEYISQK